MSYVARGDVCRKLFAANKVIKRGSDWMQTQFALSGRIYAGQGASSREISYVTRSDVCRKLFAANKVIKRGSDWMQTQFARGKQGD